MVTWLGKRLVEGRETDQRQAWGALCSLVGIGLNILLFAGKYLAGVLSGSIAITADAFNNLSDAGSSVITLFGFRFAGRRADREHPFGHGRMEYLSGLAVSVAILVMGVELLRSSAEKILRPEPVEPGFLSMGILAASVAVKVYMYLYNRKIGEKISSAAMKATAADSLSDAAATSVVFFSMAMAKVAGINADGWCGALVALFILKAGYGAAKDTMDPLLGQPPAPEFTASIRRIALSRPEIIGIHDLVVHDYGPGNRMISFHGEVDGSGDIFALHDAIDKTEAELRETLGCEAVIHMDPVDLKDPELEEKKAETARLIQSIDKRLTLHDFRIVRSQGATKLIFDVVEPYDLDMKEAELTERIQDLVKGQWDGCVALVHVDHSYV